MRVKTGFTRKRRHKKVLKATKGYYGSRNRLYKMAHEAFIKAGEHAFAGRRLKKRQSRKLWIQRINAGLLPHNLKYSVFINKLSISKVELNRKMLAELLVNDQKTFDEVVKRVSK